MAGGVVGDDLVGNALLGQFPGGQRRALAARAGFVAKDMELPAGALRRVERRGGGADVHAGQPAGVAVREHAHAVADQPGAEPADGLAICDARVGESFGRGQRQSLSGGHRWPPAHGGPHLAHGIDRVDGGRPRCRQRAFDPVHVPAKGGGGPAAKCPRALRQAVRGGGGDGRGAAHHHLPDGSGGVAIVNGRDGLEPVRQRALVDQHDGVGADIEFDRAPISPAAADGHIHGGGGIVIRGGGR